MLEVDIPGWKDLRLELLELDVNGTLSRDGLLLPEVQGRIAALQHVLEVRLLSADTFGPGDSCRRLGVQAQRLRRGESEAEQKGRLIRQVGAERIVAIANGAMSAKGARSKMLEVDVPGWQWLRLDQLVLDVNGTLTCDGVLLPGIREQVAAVRSILEVRLLSADTFGRLDSIASELGVAGQRLVRGDAEAPQKARVVRDLGAERVVAIGNGANDVAMLNEAALSIAVLGPEGLAVPALLAADVLVASIADALELLLRPKRLIATLRR